MKLTNDGKIHIELSLAEAVNLFCYFQVACLIPNEDNKKYIAIAEKLRFALEGEIND